MDVTVGGSMDESIVIAIRYIGDEILKTLVRQRAEESEPGSSVDRSDDIIRDCKSRVASLRNICEHLWAIGGSATMTAMTAIIDLRSRAILFARQLEFTADVTATMDARVLVNNADTSGDEYWTPSSDSPANCIIISSPTQFRIGIDNMLADAFERGYQAAVDDRTPVRALRGTVKGRKSKPRK
jgi:hypothetical protein